MMNNLIHALPSDLPSILFIKSLFLFYKYVTCAVCDETILVADVKMINSAN